MQQKITFSELCSAISQRAGLPRRETEDFLRAMFSLVADSLAKGESVKIKGIGTFKLVAVGARKSVDVTTGAEIRIPGHSKVSFVPAKALAAAVNAPFAAFEPVEMAESLTEQELEATGVEESAAPASEAADESVTTVADEPSEAPLAPFILQPSDAAGEMPSGEETVIEESAEDASAFSDGYVDESRDPAEETPPEQPQRVENPEWTVTECGGENQECGGENQGYGAENQGYGAENQGYGAETASPSPQPGRNGRRPKYGFIGGFVCALAMVALIAIVVILFFPGLLRYSDAAPDSLEALYVDVKEQVVSPQNAVPSRPVSAREAAEKESLTPPTASSQPQESTQTAAAAEEPSAAPQAKVYDTITRTRYLTTMAKEHYGNYHLWPYIYEENKAFLGHPDHIRPGTRVVVPPLSKYGVDPSDPDDIIKAKRKGVAIYAAFNADGSRKRR